MTKVTIRDHDYAYGIKTVEVGEMFRFANGKSTEVVYLCLSFRNEGYNRIMLAKNMNTGVLQELWTSGSKERVIIYVEPLELVVRDVSSVEHGKPTLGDDAFDVGVAQGPPPGFLGAAANPGGDG